MKRMLTVVFILILSLAHESLASEHGKVTSRRVADGVYLFTTASYGDVGMCGNSVAILSDEGVLVFDSASLPETAAAILDEIRKLTEKPVRYLVNSHWHWEHWGGNETYLSAFPGLQIITHENTRRQMMEVEPRWNDNGLNVQLPAYLESLEKGIAKARSQDVSEAEIQEREELLKADRNFYNQKVSLRKTIPDVTFSDSMTVRPGGREIRILHARAITIGDTYLYLPREKILIAGDIMLNPFPFAIGGSYPTDWLKTLESFAALQPALIIPGHGDALPGSEFIERYLAAFRGVLKQVQDAKAKEWTKEKTQESASAHLTELASKFGITDSGVANQLKMYFLDVFVSRAYQELNHPLGDLPDGL